MQSLLAKLRSTLSSLAKAVVGRERLGRMQCALAGIRLRFGSRARFAAIRQPTDVVFFTNDTAHWPVVRHIIERLRASQPRVRIAFATSVRQAGPLGSLDDLGAAVYGDVPMHAVREFNARVLVTPVMLLPAWLAPRNSRSVHLIQSMASLDGPFDGGSGQFSGYDYVLCAGPHQIESFQLWARRVPSLAGRWVIPAGYPKLDLMLQAQSRAPQNRATGALPHVIYAPTHRLADNDALASQHTHGAAIVDALLEAGYRVTFRPHPVSLRNDERAGIDRVAGRHRDNPRFTLDTRRDYSESYAAADLMVTDVSGTGFTFSFCFLRPCIFFAPSVDAERGLVGIQYQSRERIGAVARTIGELRDATARLLAADLTAGIRQFRAETVFRVGESAEYIASCVGDIAEGRDRPEWTRL